MFSAVGVSSTSSYVQFSSALQVLTFIVTSHKPCIQVCAYTDGNLFSLIYRSYRSCIKYFISLIEPFFDFYDHSKMFVRLTGFQCLEWEFGTGMRWEEPMATTAAQSACLCFKNASTRLHFLARPQKLVAAAHTKPTSAEELLRYTFECLAAE